jgi:hypothetical protein
MTANIVIRRGDHGGALNGEKAPPNRKERSGGAWKFSPDLIPPRSSD